MRVFGWVLPALIALGLSSCCHVNQLKAHLPSIHKVLVVPMISGGPMVNIQSPQSGNAAVNAIGGMVSAAAAVDSYARIRRAAQPERLAGVFYRTLTSQVAASLGFQMVSENQPHDTELQLEVGDYGIRQLSADSPVEYFFDAEARLVRLSDGEVIWQDCEDIAGPLSPVLVYGPGASTANTAIGIATITSLDPDQLAAMFDRIAQDAGLILAHSMDRDSKLDS